MGGSSLVHHLCLALFFFFPSPPVGEGEVCAGSFRATRGACE